MPPGSAVCCAPARPCAAGRRATLQTGKDPGARHVFHSGTYFRSRGNTASFWDGFLVERGDDAQNSKDGAKMCRRIIGALVTRSFVAARPTKITRCPCGSWKRRWFVLTPWMGISKARSSRRGAANSPRFPMVASDQWLRADSTIVPSTWSRGPAIQSLPGSGLTVMFCTTPTIMVGSK